MLIGHFCLCLIDTHPKIRKDDSIFLNTIKRFYLILPAGLVKLTDHMTCLVKLTDHIMK